MANSDPDMSLERTDVLTARVDTLAADVAVLKADVADIKTAIWRLTELTVDFSERLTALEKSIDSRFQMIGERLDRLILMSLRDRTEGIERLSKVTQVASPERLADIERRLSTLEQRAGI
jgi:DNA-binding HxlR family transcriptional regulator